MKSRLSARANRSSLPLPVKRMSENDPAPLDLPPPLPALDWEEVEAGRDGQLPLPGIDPAPTRAERAFLVLAREWHERFSACRGDGAPPREVDLLALAALLLAVEHGARFTDIAERQIEANLRLPVSRGTAAWIDQLPWCSARAARMAPPFRDRELGHLIANLTHHKSALRIWTMEVAWVCRTWLDPAEVVPRLFENVASTLVGVSRAWGLARAFHETNEALLGSARIWAPDGFADQYEARVERFGADPFAAQAPYWHLEAGLWKRIAEVMEQMA